jgi:hypothetical protein
MACPNFKKGLKMAFGPLGVNDWRQFDVNVGITSSGKEIMLSS